MEWISVKDKLPPYNYKVLAYSDSEFYVAWRKKVDDFDDVWCYSECCGCNVEKILGWCELPKICNGIPDCLNWCDPIGVKNE